MRRMEWKSKPIQREPTNDLILILNLRLSPSTGLGERLDDGSVADSQFQPFVRGSDPISRKVNNRNEILRRGVYNGPQKVAHNVRDHDPPSLCRDHVERQREEQERHGFPLLPASNSSGIELRGLLLQLRDPLLQFGDHRGGRVANLVRPFLFGGFLRLIGLLLKWGFGGFEVVRVLGGSGWWGFSLFGR